MSFRDWIMTMLYGSPRQHAPNKAHKELTRRQLDVAGRLAEMKGVTRDDVLKEAYRRARLAQEERSYRPRQ